MSLDASGTRLGRRAGPGPTPDIPPASASHPRPSPVASRGTSSPLRRIAPDASAVLTGAYQDNQAALGNYVTTAIRSIWAQHIDPENFSGSWRDIGPVVKVIVAQHYAASAADAADYYRNMHVVNGLRLPAVRDSILNAGHLNRMAGAVANGNFYHQLNTQKVDPARASEIARNVMSGAGARFALQGGRSTVMAAVANDPDATGWERIMTPIACSYCSMQAAQGPFKPGNTRFRAHDYCHCLAAPVLRGRQPGNQDVKQAWDKLTGGLSGDDARAAWDDYWAGGRNATNTTH